MKPTYVGEDEIILPPYARLRFIEVEGHWVEEDDRRVREWEILARYEYEPHEWASPEPADDWDWNWVNGLIGEYCPSQNSAVHGNNALTYGE